MAQAALLCLCPQGLADHVVSLVGDAGVTAYAIEVPDGALPRPVPSDYLAIVVSPEDVDRARSVIELVLPQLLEDPTRGAGLSENLTRTETDDGSTIEPLPVWRGPSASVLDESEEDDEFVPPEPPPVPAPRDLRALFGWVAAIGGPILLIVGLILGWDGLAATAGIILFFAGFITLIWRYEHRRNSDDDFDNGAVV